MEFLLDQNSPRNSKITEEDFVLLDLYYTQRETLPV